MKRPVGLGRGMATLIPNDIIWSGNLWDIPVVYAISAAQAGDKETIRRLAGATLDSTLRDRDAIIPIDSAEVRAFTQDSDSVVVGFGSATGQASATVAAETALSAQLMTETIATAQSVILAIQGGSNLGLPDIQAITNVVQERTTPTANLIIGVAKSDSLNDEIRVTILAAK